NLIQRNQSAAFSSGKVRPNHETNINIIARRTGKDVNSHTRSEERFSRNAETDLVCRLLLEKKKRRAPQGPARDHPTAASSPRLRRLRREPRHLAPATYA